MVILAFLYQVDKQLGSILLIPSWVVCILNYYPDRKLILCVKRIIISVITYSPNYLQLLVKISEFIKKNNCPTECKIKTFDHYLINMILNW